MRNSHHRGALHAGLGGRGARAASTRAAAAREKGFARLFQPRASTRAAAASQKGVALS